MSTGAIEFAGPKWMLYLWGFALALLVLYLILMLRDQMAPAGAHRKPCHGCSDADLGLTLDEEAK